MCPLLPQRWSPSWHLYHTLVGTVLNSMEWGVLWESDFLASFITVAFHVAHSFSLLSNSKSFHFINILQYNIFLPLQYVSDLRLLQITLLVNTIVPVFQYTIGVNIHSLWGTYLGINYLLTEFSYLIYITVQKWSNYSNFPSNYESSTPISPNSDHLKLKSL